MSRAGLRHYPPVRTPLSLKALVSASPKLATRSDDSLRELTSYLTAAYRADNAVLYSTGTQALTAAIVAAFDLQFGERIVALPSYNCYDVATAAVGADARIVIYDIDPETLAPDPESFNAALRAGASVAVVASLYGYPIDWHQVEHIAAKHGVIVIEDAAQGIGGSWNGAPLGSFGRLSVLSFGRGKGWTGGGGGALLHRDSSISRARAREAPRGAGAKAAARAFAQWVLSNPAIYAMPAAMPWLHLGETVYKPPRAASEITPFEAALLLATAPAAQREVEQRASVGALATELFANARHARSINAVHGGTPGWLRFPLRITSKPLRDRVLTEYSRFGVAAGYPDSIARLPEIRSRICNSPSMYTTTDASYTGSDALVRELVTLPTYSHANRDFVRELVEMFA